MFKNEAFIKLANNTSRPIIYQWLDILNDSRYELFSDDFPKGFHRTLFSALSNLAALGTEHITPQTLEDYLSDKPQSYAEYKAGDGPRFVKSCMANADFQNFDYYYNRIKKLTLMQAVAYVLKDALGLIGVGTKEKM